MKRIAIIDLGTNTFNILIIERLIGKADIVIFRDKIPVKLGEGGINLGIICEVPFQRGLNAMQTYSQKIKEFNCDQIFAFATSAIRSAKNGKNFCEEVFLKTQIEIQIIDGEREAELIYKGVKQSGVLGAEKSLILDIGGGSCEFIICNQELLFWKHSFDLGVSRLFDRFKHHNPIWESEKELLENLFTTELEPLFEALKQFPTTELVGSSGSFDTFAEMICYKKDGNNKAAMLPKYEFHLADFFENHRLILDSTIEERQKIPGLVAMRVDMIVISSIMVNFLIQKLQIQAMKVSAFSLKEGVISELDNLI